jgi:hypothetical protein
MRQNTIEYIDELGEDKHVLKVNMVDKPCNRQMRIDIVHDYVRFYSYNSVTKSGGKGGVEIPVTVTIPIRAMIQSVIPMLNYHENTQPETLFEDGKDSRYRFSATYLEYWKDGELMVDVYEPYTSPEEPAKDTVTKKVFDKYIKPYLDIRLKERNAIQKEG